MSSLNQSNRSISVRLSFLFCSRVFISRSYEYRSMSKPPRFTHNPLLATRSLTFISLKGTNEDTTDTRTAGVFGEVPLLAQNQS